MNMLLENKVAVIYGAGGSSGGAVACALTSTEINISCGAIVDWTKLLSINIKWGIIT